MRAAKGIDIILSAFKEFNIEYPRSSLRIVGEGDYEQDLKDKVDRDDISGVTFTGLITDRAKLNKEYRDADIFLFASYSEGSPRVVLEAIANGLVVISTPVGSLPSTFKDGTEILFANFGDSSDFIKLMHYVASNKYKACKIRQNAYKRIENMTVSNFIRKIFK